MMAGMTAITVQANAHVAGLKPGQIVEVERTPVVRRLAENGFLTIVTAETDPPHPPPADAPGDPGDVGKAEPPADPTVKAKAPKPAKG